jgi:hypothetical protein
VSILIDVTPRRVYYYFIERGNDAAAEAGRTKMAKKIQPMKTDAELRAILRKILNDWSNGTENQRAEAVRLAATMAARAERGL